MCEWYPHLRHNLAKVMERLFWVCSNRFLPYSHMLVQNRARVINRHVNATFYHPLLLLAEKQRFGNVFATFSWTLETLAKTFPERSKSSIRKVRCPTSGALFATFPKTSNNRCKSSNQNVSYSVLNCFWGFKQKIQISQYYRSKLPSPKL